MLQDWHLVLVVLALVVVDLVILVLYTVVEGARGNLGAKKIVSVENPMDTKGVSYQLCTCTYLEYLRTY